MWERGKGLESDCCGSCELMTCSIERDSNDGFGAFMLCLLISMIRSKALLIDKNNHQPT